MWLFEENSYQNARQNLNFILQNQPATASQPSTQPNQHNLKSYQNLSPTKSPKLVVFMTMPCETKLPIPFELLIAMPYETNRRQILLQVQF